MERKIAQSQEGRQAEKALQTEENRGSAFSGVGEQPVSDANISQKEGVPGQLKLAGRAYTFPGDGDFLSAGSAEPSGKPDENEERRAEKSAFFQGTLMQQYAAGVEDIMGEPLTEEDRRVMGLTYDILEEVNGGVGQLQEGIRQAPETKDALVSVLLAPHLVTRDLDEHIRAHISKGIAFGTPLREGYEASLRAVRDLYDLEDHTQNDQVTLADRYAAAVMKNPHQSAAAVWEGICGSDCATEIPRNVETLMSLISRTDPEENPVALEVENKRIIGLHINKVSTSPFRQGSRVLHGLEEIRSQRPSDLQKTHNEVMGISWLIRPDTERALARMGLSREAGVDTFYVDIERLLDDPEYNSPAFRWAPRERILSVATMNVLHSPSGIATFLRDRRPPDVGVMLAPVSTFFRDGTNR